MTECVTDDECTDPSEPTCQDTPSGYRVCSPGAGDAGGGSVDGGVGGDPTAGATAGGAGGGVGGGAGGDFDGGAGGELGGDGGEIELVECAADGTCELSDCPADSYGCGCLSLISGKPDITY